MFYKNFLFLFYKKESFMQCCNPKILPVVGPDKSIITYQFIPCGKCYACQCAARGQMVVRMREEIKDRYNKSAYFITLTYSDRNLPVCIDNWPSVSNYYHLMPMAYRKYDYSILVPEHLSNFMSDLSREFRLKYCNSYLDKHHNVIDTEPNTHIRYYATGEYGDISHRAHFHACILFPRDIHHEDCVRLVRSVWQNGCTNIQPIDTVGACNYVAKHQVKECEGSKFQQLVSPIFARYSVYEGGLGRIMKNDNEMKQRYLDSLRTRDKLNLYYKAYQDGHEYKVAIPRFLIKSWHPSKFTDEELVMSQGEGFEKLREFIFVNLKDNFYLSDDFRDALQFVDFQLSNFCYDRRFDLYKSNDLNNYAEIQRIQKILTTVSQPLISEDRQRKKAYVNKHISKKLKQLAGGASEDSMIY